MSLCRYLKLWFYVVAYFIWKKYIDFKWHNANADYFRMVSYIPLVSSSDVNRPVYKYMCLHCHYPCFMPIKPAGSENGWYFEASKKQKWKRGKVRAFTYWIVLFGVDQTNFGLLQYLWSLINSSIFPRFLTYTKLFLGFGFMWTFEIISALLAEATSKSDW